MGSMVHMAFTKFSGSSFTLETGGTVVTDSLEELALNLRKGDSSFNIPLDNVPQPLLGSE